MTKISIHKKVKWKKSWFEKEQQYSIIKDLIFKYFRSTFESSANDFYLQATKENQELLLFANSEKQFLWKF